MEEDSMDIGDMLRQMPAVVEAALEAAKNEDEHFRQEIEDLMNCMLDCVVKVENERSRVSRQIQSSEAQVEHFKTLVKGYQDNCASAEDCALDFIANQVHHPVISCFREVTRADLNLICGDQLKKNSTELEQALVCVGLMDYIATSLKNPLYGELFCKSLHAVRLSVRRLFVEMKRILADWDANSPDTYRSGKEKVMKYLGDLTPFFSLVQYDKPYSKALNLLDRVASRSQRHPKLTTTSITTLDRPALSEIRANQNPELMSPPSDKSPSQIDLTDETFDFLEDSPAPPAKKTASLFLKSKSKQLKTKKPVMIARFPQKSVKLTKRPSVELIESDTKRIRVETEFDTDTIKKEPTPTVAPAAPKPSVGTNAKVNAFAFMMNRSKEMAKMDKLKKQLKSDVAMLKIQT